MIQYVEIEGKEYPFKFGMREINKLSQMNNLEFDEVEQAVQLDFDVLLDLFHLASKKGARRDESDNVLSPLELEDAIDDDPQVLMNLQQAFRNSNAFQFITEQGQQTNEQAGNEKKPSD